MNKFSWLILLFLSIVLGVLAVLVLSVDLVDHAVLVSVFAVVCCLLLSVVVCCCLLFVVDVVVVCLLWSSSLLLFL